MNRRFTPTTSLNSRGAPALVALLLLSGTLFTAVLPGQASAAPVAAVLPSSRSVEVGTPATVFATIINADDVTATGCAVALNSALNLDFSYQTTDAASNALTGSPNTPADIAAGGNQSFLLSITPNQAFSASDIEFSFTCGNTGTAPVTAGINTLLLAASNTPVADVIAIALTPSGDGIASIAQDRQFGFFSLATSNVGAADTVSVSAAASVNIDGAVLVCETNPGTGECLEAPSASVSTNMASNATNTFAVFAQSGDLIPLDPAGRRISVNFTDSSDNTAGSTSVAMQGGGYTAFGFFEAMVSEPIIQSNCIQCHVAGGVASGTRLRYLPSSMSNHVSANFEQLASFVALSPNNANVVASKAQGLLGHGGGVRLQPTDPLLADLVQFLDLLAAE